MNTPTPAPSSRTPWAILKATLLALVVAVLVLVVAVLPAEYGLDLTGAGRLLGLNALASEETTAIVSQERAYKTDTIEFVLGSYESVEYKYRLDAAASLQYSWEATRPVIYDFHAEPDGAPAGYAESFDQQTRGQSHGTYVAPFPGIHGWYWENPGTGDIAIRLTSAGFYSEAIEFRGSGKTEKKF